MHLNRETKSVKRAFGRSKRSKQLKDSILSTLSHELRTPVATIVANTELLCEYGDEGMTADDRAVFLHDLSVASNRLSRRVGSIMKMARLDKQSAQPRWQEFVLDEIGRKLVAGMEEGAVEVVWACDSPDQKVVLDADGVATAFECVVDNALRYARREVTIQRTARGGVVEIAVTDDGPGVPDGVQPHLFSLFEQGVTRDGVLEDKPEGIGVGLSLARASLQCSGGEVVLESTGPEGSRFCIRVPDRQSRDESVEALDRQMVSP